VSVDNPFAGHQLVSPTLSFETAAQVLADRYGRTGPLKSLGSHQDQNFLADCPDGRFVLKISNPGFTRVGLEAQNAAMLHLAVKDIDFRVPVPLPDVNGDLIGQIDDQGRTFDVRLVTFLDGSPLSEFEYLAPIVLQRHGALAAQAAQALADFSHEGLDRVLQWDCRRAGEVVDALVDHVADAERRTQIRGETDRAMSALNAVDSSLRLGVVHADATDVNVVVTVGPDGRPIPDGLIDFGDMLNTWIVSDVAVAAVSLVVHDLDRPVHVVSEIAKGFHSAYPLTKAEAGALWPMVIARAAACCVSSEQQALMEPHNDYAQESRESDWRIWDAIRSIPWPLAQAVIQNHLGLLGWATPDTSSWVPVVQLPADASILDQSVTGDSTPTRREFAVGRYGEGRLNESNQSSVTTGAEIFAPAGTPVVAPASGRVIRAGDKAVHLAIGDVGVVLCGLAPSVQAGTSVQQGDLLGHMVELESTGPLLVQLVTTTEVMPPHFADSSTGWHLLAIDPSPLLDTDVVDSRSTPEELIGRRDAVLATAQEHYYDDPPRIERGTRHFLFDSDGRRYLDMVNNVTILGHSHPAVHDAVERQLRLINTNSRFNYGAMVDLAEQISALLPEPLDTVFLVSTGSEANEVALRLVRAATAAKDIVAVKSAYHGWTTATDEISTSIADNPAAVANRPEWIHVIDSPNPYRGAHRGDAAAKYASEAISELDAIADSGRQIAAFVAEPVYGNAGGMLLPEGYLHAIYEKVRGLGGLCVSDEVQVGYGRLGHHFWGFEQQGVTPDVVTMAKCTGNGIPVGAVVTTRAIADALQDAEGSFFSSMGGSPVGAAAGLAVLETMRREGLQQNAATVGDHMKRRLEELMSRHPMIGTVHGMGLYLGIELVQHPETLEPASHQALAICDRMLELGVVVQPTSDHMNVLKVKPPLCIDIHSADHFVDALDRTLSEGW